MRFRSLAICLLLSCLAIPATVARAQDELPDYDARTQGYPTGMPTHMEDSGTIGAWFIFVPLAAITLGVLFRNAKRTHLD